MPQKYGSVADSVAPAERSACVVCDESPRFSWTDKHGEAYCRRCGTPYQLLDKGQRIMPECNIAEHAIPVLRRYFAETSRGNGLGTFIIWRDYPDQQEDRRAFNAWCDAHPELIPEDDGTTDERT